jgi:HJR/Mrr/RecB family endonuclease
LAGSCVRFVPIPDVGDQGVDIEAMREGALIAVQCQQYNRPIGTKSVHQEVCAGKTH